MPQGKSLIKWCSVALEKMMEMIRFKKLLDKKIVLVIERGNAKAINHDGEVRKMESEKVLGVSCDFQGDCEEVMSWVL